MGNLFSSKGDGPRHGGSGNKSPSRSNAATNGTQFQLRVTGVEGASQHPVNHHPHHIQVSPSPKSASPWRTVAQHEHNRSFICRFCGGKQCKHEDYRQQTEGTPAVQGLNSTWITSTLLAMQRPSTRLIAEHKIVEQFKQHQVTAVINCQLSGEHALCGDGIHTDSGFSYKYEEFSDHQIAVYPFGWEDMNTPTVEMMLEIVHSIDYHIAVLRTKVAIHCHAGYGRTGLVLACYLLYTYTTLTPETAIVSVRERRRGCIQTSKQQKFVEKFYTYLCFLRQQYAISAQTSNAASSSNVTSVRIERTSITQMLKRQSLLLHGNEKTQYLHQPKVIDQLCQRLTTMLLSNHSSASQLCELAVEGSRIEAANTDVSSSTAKPSAADDSTINAKQLQSSIQQLQTAHQNNKVSIQYNNSEYKKQQQSLPPKWTSHNVLTLNQHKAAVNSGNLAVIAQIRMLYIIELLCEYCSFTLSTPLISLPLNALTDSRLDAKHVAERYICREALEPVNAVINVLRLLISRCTATMTAEQHAAVCKALLRFACTLCLPYGSDSAPLSCITQQYWNQSEHQESTSSSITSQQANSDDLAAYTTSPVRLQPQQYNNLLSLMLNLIQQWPQLYKDITNLQHTQNMMNGKVGWMSARWKHMWKSTETDNDNGPPLTKRASTKEVEASVAAVDRDWQSYKALASQRSSVNMAHLSTDHDDPTAAADAVVDKNTLSPRMLPGSRIAKPSTSRRSNPSSPRVAPSPASVAVQAHALASAAPRMSPTSLFGGDRERVQADTAVRRTSVERVSPTASSIPHAASVIKTPTAATYTISHTHQPQPTPVPPTPDHHTVPISIASTPIQFGNSQLRQYQSNSALAHSSSNSTLTQQRPSYTVHQTPSQMHPNAAQPSHIPRYTIRSTAPHPITSTSAVFTFPTHAANNATPSAILATPSVSRTTEPSPSIDHNRMALLRYKMSNESPKTVILTPYGSTAQNSPAGVPARPTRASHDGDASAAYQPRTSIPNNLHQSTPVTQSHQRTQSYTIQLKKPSPFVNAGQQVTNPQQPQYPTTQSNASTQGGNNVTG